jgi:F-type H+-transporting ATPase subunit gamma
MNKKEIQERIETLGMLMGLTEAYSEVSSQRMKKIREGVITSRDFLESIDSIFRELRNSQRREIIRLAKKKGKGDTVTFLAHNGKTVSVFIAANAGLYGDIINRVFTDFINEVRSKNTEVTIVGKLGLSLFLSAEPKRPYTYFDYPDYGDNSENLASITRHLVSYEEIHIFYGKFKNIAYQEVASRVIAAETDLSADSEEAVTKYLFEPDLNDILAFFEGEMFTSTFEQVLREAQLAKFSSRMISMDKAGEKIKEELKQTQMEHLKMAHYLSDKKQQAVFGSFHLW